MGRENVETLPTLPKEKCLLLRAGFEPATYGYLPQASNYSPPLYQLSYRRCWCNKREVSYMNLSMTFTLFPIQTLVPVAQTRPLEYHSITIVGA